MDTTWMKNTFKEMAEAKRGHILLIRLILRMIFCDAFRSLCFCATSTAKRCPKRKESTAHLAHHLHYVFARSLSHSVLLLLDFDISANPAELTLGMPLVDVLVPVWGRFALVFGHPGVKTFRDDYNPPLALNTLVVFRARAPYFSSRIISASRSACLFSMSAIAWRRTS